MTVDCWNRTVLNKNYMKENKSWKRRFYFTVIVHLGSLKALATTYGNNSLILSSSLGKHHTITHGSKTELTCSFKPLRFWNSLFSWLTKKRVFVSVNLCDNCSSTFNCSFYIVQLNSPKLSEHNALNCTWNYWWLGQCTATHVWR